MINQFPTIYPDELFYSVIARYHVRTGDMRQKESLNDLFNEVSISKRPYVEFPCGLESLHSKVSLYTNATVDEWIQKHTLVPYYASFTGESNRGQLTELVRKGERNGLVFNSSGAMKYTIPPPTYLRYCPICLNEDEATVGETYWRRSHQLPGVTVCVKHAYPLHDSQVLYGHRSHEPYVAATFDVCDGGPSFIPSTAKSEWLVTRIAQESVKLLANHQGMELTRIHSFYENALREKGCVGVKGRFDHQALYHSFRAFFEPNLLHVLHHDRTFQSWRMIMPHSTNRPAHPLSHILLLLYCHKTVDDLMKWKTKAYEPFGEGPFPCLNRAASHYRKNVIQSVNVIRNKVRGLPQGIFSCHCGFQYTRLGPDPLKQQIFVTHSVRKYGSLWYNTIQQMVDGGYPIYRIAQLLNVSRSLVREHYAKKCYCEIKRQEGMLLFRPVF
ncbi:TnsD family Tn7-like transposition protein [Gottfriedia sp. NPDC056225]|uniref:TnsD family Tn7-like transposition protein n=1 Tax=Gottfriedia sp. NPDC056225 TaxID=3345751 RepID=UPI0035E1083C